MKKRTNNKQVLTTKNKIKDKKQPFLKFFKTKKMKKNLIKKQDKKNLKMHIEKINLLFYNWGT